MTTRIPGKELDGPLGTLIRTAMRKKVGSVPKGAEVMWNYPKIFTDSLRIGRISEKWNRLDRSLGTLAVMAAAAEIGCSACLDFHYFLVHTKGLDEMKARQVPRWRDSPVFSPLERRAMEYAVAMCQTPLAVTDEMSAALLAELGPDGLLELTARVGLINMSARTNIALGITSEHFADSCGLPPMAAPAPTAPATTAPATTGPAGAVPSQA